MASERRKQLLLAILVVVLGAVAYRLWPSSTAADSAAASKVRGSARAPSGRPAVTAPDVRLEALDQPRPKPQELERNLFRFKPKAAPAPVPSTASMKPSPPPPTGPPPPPSVAPIALKFIGILEIPEQKKRIAVLSDGKGGVSIYGAEGDTVEGRYKIVRIGAESIEMSYLDGRGRQTIRLTGQ